MLTPASLKASALRVKNGSYGGHEGAGIDEDPPAFVKIGLKFNGFEFGCGRAEVLHGHVFSQVGRISCSPQEAGPVRLALVAVAFSAVGRDEGLRRRDDKTAAALKRFERSAHVLMKHEERPAVGGVYFFAETEPGGFGQKIAADVFDGGAGGDLGEVMRVAHGVLRLVSLTL